METEPQERTHTNQGTVYVFANVYMYPEKPGTTGKIKKFDVLTGKTVWEIPDPYPNWGGAMVTDGGLVFYGSLGGDFRAVDRELRQGRCGAASSVPASSATRSPTRSVASSTYRCLFGHRRLDRPAGDRWSRPQRQVRRHRRHGHDQGRWPEPHPAGWRAERLPRLWSRSDLTGRLKGARYPCGTGRFCLI